MDRKVGTCLRWQECHLQIYCQEETSSPSFHQEAGERATKTNAHLEKEEASDHLCVWGQRKQGPSRGARPSPRSRTRLFVNRRYEGVFNRQQRGRRDQILLWRYLMRRYAINNDNARDNFGGTYDQRY